MHSAGVRAIFLEALVDTKPLLRSEALEAAWERPSALERMTIGSLAAHLGRALFNVERYLDASIPEPEEPPIGVGEYYASILTTTDLDAPVNVEVRERSDADAGMGRDPLIERFELAVGSLRERLPAEHRDRRMRVFSGLVMRLDDYLVTRLIECVVHADDLAVSLDVPLPRFDPAALQLVIDGMLDTARTRHGHIAVIRALARRERDPIDALRVL